MIRFLNKKKDRLTKKLRRAKEGWKDIFASLFLRESAVIIFLSLIIFISLGTIFLKQAKNYIKTFPVNGGVYTEGLVGKPQSLNPLYAQGSSIDRSIVSLIYSKLIKIDEFGVLKPDLAESWETSEDKTKYTIHLRKDAFWHDGERVLSEDVLYTYSTCQDPDYIGPLKNQFKDVTIEAPDDYTIVFTELKNSSNFLEKLSLGIIPQHRWSNYPTADLPYLEQNLTPVGSGPFSFKNATTDGAGKILNIILEKNNRYYLDKPYLDSIIFKFYSDDSEIKNAITKKEIDGSPNIDSSTYKELEGTNRIRFYSYQETGYKAIFFNSEKTPILANKEIRNSINLVINRNQIDETLYKKSEGLADAFNKFDKKQDYNKQIEEARKLISDAGGKDENNDGTMEINGQPLSLILSINSDNESIAVSKIIKENLKQIGIELKVDEKNATEFERDVLNPRNYQLVLLGQNYGKARNLYAFWHSSQTQSPGLNFSQTQSKRIDALLENYLTKTDEAEKQKIVETLNKIITEEHYAVFLYKPLYIYITDKKIMGVTKNYFALPEDRFIDIEKWYTKTRWSLNI